MDKLDSNATNGDSAYKWAILKCGGISCGICGASKQGEEYVYYDSETFAQYNPNPEVPNHEIFIVGWDDTFPADNFGVTPPGDGAWICKNSWGTNWGDGGYFYVSYYDTTFATYCFDGVGFLFENTIPYNKNYQHDINEVNKYFYKNGNPVTYMNIFEACDDDLIAAVGTYFEEEGIEYKVEIIVNGELVYTQTGISPYFGYHTIKLDKYIPIKKGDNFAAAVTSISMPFVNVEMVRLHYTQGLSYKVENSNWIDLYDEGIACLKVYTVADDSKIIDNKDIAVDYGSGSSFSVKAVTADGHAVVGVNVNFTINGKTKTVKTGSDGIAEINITEVPGTYVITTVYNGQSYENNVAVRLVLENSKVVAKNIAVDYAGGSYFTAKVLSSDGKVAVGGKSVIFVFNGKVITAKTDKNGIAKIKITQNPGKYTIKTIFNGKTYTNKITVKHVLTASKVTVKKTAKKFTLKARLKINGKLIKGKWITFKFNGKTYKAKTNFKGIAQKTFNRNVIKNLKKGRTYAVRVVYAKGVIKTTVKVR